MAEPTAAQLHRPRGREVYWCDNTNEPFIIQFTDGPFGPRAGEYAKCTECGDLLSLSNPGPPPPWPDHHFTGIIVNRPPT